MLPPVEALDVELVDIFCTGWTGGEPALRSDHLESADGRAVAWSSCHHGRDLVAGQSCGFDLIRGELREDDFLFRRGRGVNPFVDRLAEFLGQVPIELRRVFPCCSHHLGSK